MVPNVFISGERSASRSSRYLDPNFTFLIIESTFDEFPFSVPLCIVQHD